MAGRADLRVMELGGGSWPRFTWDELPKNVASYIVNDIDQRLLDRIPGGYDKLCFDVAGASPPVKNCADLIFSQFMAEHVKDGAQFHRNVFELLAPGGLAFHFIPTLFASPFVINRFFPETVTRKLIETVYPFKKTGDYPKFPAYYSYCRADERLIGGLLNDIGYDKITIEPFWGHPYYDKIPVVREIEGAVMSLSARRNWKAYASYAYIKARKPR